ncbi:hypothetical protein QQ045_008221 [Rhodiola kirilowii]
MEGVATTAYTGIKSYWRRKGYRRLHAKQQPVDDLGFLPTSNGQRRRFKIGRPRLKLGRFRIRLGLGSVRMFFLKIRDAYVNAMLGLANKGIWVGAGDGGMGGFGGGGGRVKEYDEKMLVEIYKRMVLARQQGQLGTVAVGGGRKVGSGVAPVCSF